MWLLTVICLLFQDEMKLLGNFYSVDGIELKQDCSYVVKVTLFAEHKIYEGHFPMQPVVPGVCTLTVIREVLGIILSRNVSFSRIKECKYLSALIPNSDLKITLNIELLSPASVKVCVENDAEQKIVLKLRAEI